jgi:ribosomal protein L7/L12
MRFFYWLAFYVNRAKFEYARGARDGFAARVETDKLARVKAVLKDTDNIVTAVKLHRELFGSSLKEAVDTVRAMKDTL